jgi:putative effector of murein hydrolase
MRPWTIALGIVAAVLYALSISNEFYHATSPQWLSWHVALRKTYSVIAFALVAYLLRRALREGGAHRTAAACIAGVAAYSAAIEVGQFLAGSREGPLWNAFDVACGALGGALAHADSLRRRTATRAPVPGPHPR